MVLMGDTSRRKRMFYIDVGSDFKEYLNKVAEVLSSSR